MEECISLYRLLALHGGSLGHVMDPSGLNLLVHVPCGNWVSHWDVQMIFKTIMQMCLKDC